MKANGDKGFPLLDWTFSGFQSLKTGLTNKLSTPHLMLTILNFSSK